MNEYLEKIPPRPPPPSVGEKGTSDRCLKGHDPPDYGGRWTELTLHTEVGSALLLNLAGLLHIIQPQ